VASTESIIHFPRVSATAHYQNGLKEGRKEGGRAGGVSDSSVCFHEREERREGGREGGRHVPGGNDDPPLGLFFVVQAHFLRDRQNTKQRREGGGEEGGRAHVHTCRKRRPTSWTFSSLSNPTSSKAEKASADMTSAHL